MLPGMLARAVITYGVDAEADLRAGDIELGDRTASLRLAKTKNSSGRVELSVPGRHNVYNALATGHRLPGSGTDV